MSIERVFYVTSNGLSAICFDRGQTILLGKFPLTDEGVENFSDFINQAPDYPSAFVVDVIEEEFRIETIPHVTGSDHINLLERKAGAIFRNMAYTSAQVIGREKQGRCDDKIIFSALGNSDVLERWHKVTKEAKVPLVGIYSVPMLTGMLIKKFKIRHPNTLFLSIQDGYLLRQSFFKKGKLKLSRLTRLKESGDNDFLKIIHNELDKSKRYLERAKLIDFNQPMEIYILTEGEQLDSLKIGCSSTENINYHFLDINDVAVKLGLKQTLSANESEWCYASMLNSQKPKGNYARLKERAYFSQFKLRKVIVGVSIVWAVGMTLWGGMDIYSGQSLAIKTAQIEADSRMFSAELVVKDIAYPGLEYEPHVMRATVEADHQLKIHKPNALRSLMVIGSSLRKHPNVTLDQVKWKIVGDESMDDQEANGVVIETATINGRLKEFPENYHAAFNQVDALLESLRSNSQIASARALSLPLDVDPNSTLIGESRNLSDIQPATFELEIRLKVDNHDI